MSSECKASVGWIYFEYSLLFGKSVWNSYATLHEHTYGASMDEEDRRWTYTHNTAARSSNRCWRGKAVSIIYYGFVSVALVMQHAKRMHCVILSSVPCLALPYISTLSPK